MSRITPYFGIFAAILLGALILYFSSTIPIARTTKLRTSTASSTLSVEPSPPPLSLPALAPATTATSTPAPALVVPAEVIPKKKIVLPPTATEVPALPASSSPVALPISVPPLIQSGNVSLDTAASALRDALVNIICYVPTGSSLHSISGSGVIIDPKGIILTNAHIAQYFLLTDRGTSCTIRSGSPATNSYKASLIYISPAWLHANPTSISQSEPNGTGEFDFALLAVTRSATAAPLPAAFPSLPLAQVPPFTGAPVVIATYGAQFLDASQVQSSLFPTVVFGSVKDIFTFAINTIDVLALGGSAAAQEGSSGGGVADTSGKLIGTITTSTVSGTTDTRSLDAITASYIRGEYASEMGSALDLLLSEPTATAVAEFATRIPQLESILTAHLP